MNGVAQMIENSNPYLNKKGKKLVFENFMYNSMLNELSRLAEGVDDEDDGIFSHAMNMAQLKGRHAVRGAQNAWDSASTGFKKAKDYLTTPVEYNTKTGKTKTAFGKDFDNYFFGKERTDFDTDNSNPTSGLQKDWLRLKNKKNQFMNSVNAGLGAAMDNPGTTAAIAAVAAITGWGAKKAYDYVKENGPEAVEALKDKVKPSMMGKVKAKFKKIMAKMAFAESVGVNPLKVLKK